MKKVLIAAALGLVVLAGCNREEETTVVPPQTSIPDSSGSVGSAPGSETPPGAATSASGNQADMNTTDNVSTQQQLEPLPAENPKP